MPRVYHVTFTKEFEATVLADSGEALLNALRADDIDTHWDAPDEWDISIRDLARNPKDIPETVPEYVAAVVGNAVYCADDERVKDIHRRAEEELNQRWQAVRQLSLPFEKP